MNIRLLLIYFFSLSIFISAKAQEDCKLKKDQEGIKIYLCKKEGSSFKTIKVAFETKGTLKSYASGVLNIAGYKEWQNSILNIYTLENINDLELIYYSEVDAPWPVSNRDLIFHLKMDQDSITKSLTVSLKQLPLFIPAKEGIVRIPTANSLLTVIPIDSVHLQVNYVIHVDPGGDIPAFIANVFSTNTPWHTFNNFRIKLANDEFDEIENLPIENYQP